MVCISYEEIGTPSPLQETRLGQKKFKMNWINILGDDDLIKKYGDQAIPMVYLLDNKGKVIYSREEDKDYAGGKLTLLNKVLASKL